jgi:tape measure domain-containing protein
MSRKTWITFGARDFASSVIRGMTGRIANSMQDIERASRSAKRHLDAIHGTMSKRLPNFGLGGMLLGGAGIYKGYEAIEKSAEFESIANTINFVSETAVQGAKNMLFLDNIVKDLKLDYFVTAEAYKRFLGSMRGSKFTFEQQNQMFKEVGTSIRVLGMDAEKTERVYYALGEMVSKGAIQAQEAKQQMGNAYPGFMALMARAVGVSMSQLTKMMEQGELSAEKYLPKITAQMYKETIGGLDIAVDKSTARLQDYKNAWTRAMVDIGDTLIQGGVLDMVGQYVKEISGWVKANKELIKQNVGKAVEWIKNIGTFIIDNWETIWKGIKAITLALVGMKIAMAVLDIAIMLTNPLGWAAIAVGILSMGVIEAIDDIVDFRKEIKDVPKDVQDANKELHTFSGILLGLYNIWDMWFTDNPIEAMKKGAVGLAQVILSALKPIAVILDWIQSTIFRDHSNPFETYYNKAMKALDDIATEGDRTREKKKESQKQRNAPYKPLGQDEGYINNTDYIYRNAANKPTAETIERWNQWQEEKKMKEEQKNKETYEKLQGYINFNLRLQDGLTLESSTTNSPYPMMFSVKDSL